jgi:hypothetical protein
MAGLREFVLSPGLLIAVIVSFVLTVIFTKMSEGEWSSKQQKLHGVLRVGTIILFAGLVLVLLVMSIIGIFVDGDYFFLIAAAAIAGIVAFTEVKNNYRALIYASMLGVFGTIVVLAPASFLERLGYGLVAAVGAWPVIFVGVAVLYAIWRFVEGRLQSGT